MPMFIDTRGHKPLSIAICARCSRKFPRDELHPDPNAPGLLVCSDDLDVFDPWRLPARETESITIADPRPDVPIATEAPSGIYANQINGIGAALPNQPWSANMPYLKGQLVTPVNPNDPPGSRGVQNDVPLPIYQFMALSNGTSGATPPVWPTNAGVEVVDNTVTWLCVGLWIS